MALRPQGRATFSKNVRYLRVIFSETRCLGTQRVGIDRQSPLTTKTLSRGVCGGAALEESQLSHQEARSDGVLLTGATGFVGMELLARYLERTDRDVYVLVRGPNDRAAATRVERTLACLFGFGHPYAGRVTTVRGDVTRAGLGLRGGLGALAERVNEVVHSAASVSFDLELDADLAIKAAERTPGVVQHAISRVLASPRTFNLVVSNIPARASRCTCWAARCRPPIRSFRWLTATWCRSA